MKTSLPRRLSHGTQTALASGLVEFHDTNAALDQALYRSVQPQTINSEP
jgi:hypothetical protein